MVILLQGAESHYIAPPWCSALAPCSPSRWV